MEPVWNPKFTHITSYQFSDVEECYEKLNSKFEAYFKKSQKGGQKPDHDTRKRAKPTTNKLRKCKHSTF